LESAFPSVLTVMPIDGILSTFLATLVLIPVLRSLASRTSRFANVIPPIGGIAFLISVALSYALFPYAIPQYLVFGILSAWGIGALDDLSAFSPRAKTLLLLVALSVFVWLSESVWLGHPVLDLGLHTLWLLWMCNAFNVFDSVDGLSGGAGAITLLTFGFICSHIGLDTASLLCVLTAISLIAYLFYNFNPARVYMGDSGSLPLGFILGEMAWQVASSVGGFTGVATSLLVVAVFCFEGTFLILIRIAKVTMPSTSTYDHPTQRLIQAGCSVRGAAVRGYAMTVVLCGAAIVCLASGGPIVPAVFWSGVTMILVTGIVLSRIDMHGDGVDARPGSVFSKNWLVNRLVHKAMIDVSSRARGVMVDLGCGGRPYERIFRDRVDRYLGVDLDPNRYSGGDIDVVSDSEMVPIGTETVDTVLSNQVLEHLREPGDAVREMARILKPGGVAIITAPHIWGVHEEPHDYYRFTPFGLRHLAERAGLKVESVQAMAGYWVTTGARKCYYLERFDRWPLKPAIKLAYYLIQAKALVLDHVHRVEGDAWNHLMIAVKDGSVPGLDSQ
jgi:UDP-N-acetylmuramyl pentapeptide phosphotransferase/UDP-N-acetylglucosamine-1-phosphate transferase/SAM-dependent methyltransferase